MTEQNTRSQIVSQAVVAGDVVGAGGFTGQAGDTRFPVGGPDGRGGKAQGANPYDLLSASLAACTAMAIRRLAQVRKLPLSHLEVGVTFRHGGQGLRDVFDRAITLEGDLTDAERSQLMFAANTCPVGQTLSLSADIHTAAAGVAAPHGVMANYDDDLEFSIVNIDPD